MGPYSTPPPEAELSLPALALATSTPGLTCLFCPRFVTLYPGDVILTGTPPGVGVFRKPPVFLKKGDEVQCEIEELGIIINKVV